MLLGTVVPMTIGGITLAWRLRVHLALREEGRSVRVCGTERPPRSALPGFLMLRVWLVHGYRGLFRVGVGLVLLGRMGLLRVLLG